MLNNSLLNPAISMATFSPNPNPKPTFLRLPPCHSTSATSSANNSTFRSPHAGGMGPHTGRDPTLQKPDWLRQRAPQGDKFARLKHSIGELKLNTVCVEAQCPNIGEVLLLSPCATCYPYAYSYPITIPSKLFSSSCTAACLIKCRTHHFSLFPSDLCVYIL